MNDLVKLIPMYTVRVGNLPNELTDGAKAVFFDICRQEYVELHTNRMIYSENGRRLTQKSISKITKKSESTVKRAIKDLKEHHIIATSGQSMYFNPAYVRKGGDWMSVETLRLFPDKITIDKDDASMVGMEYEPPY